MLKDLAKFTAHHLGATGALRRHNEDQLRILMYHRFPRHLRSNFERQCAFIAANYTVTPLEDAVQRLKSNQPVRNMAVITIDDGYADFCDVAVPILRRYGLPATLFVTTGFINRACWMTGDRVRYHFAHSASQTVEFTDELGSGRVLFAKEPDAPDTLRAYLKRVPESTKQRILSELEAKVPLPDIASLPEEYRACTWDQLREVAGSGISIGAHTATHPILSRLGAASEVEREIMESKRELETQLQRPVNQFAYPNGTREDIDQASIDCARSHFKAAVTAMHGMNVPGMDPHLLRRLPCEPGDPIPRMALLLAGPLRRPRTSESTADLLH